MLRFPPEFRLDRRPVSQSAQGRARVRATRGAALRRAALLAGLPLCLALPAAAPAWSQAYPGTGYAGGLPNYGRPTTHGDAPEEKPQHEVAPPGEEPSVRIPAPKLLAPAPDADAIAAVVNGDVITRQDVDDRAKLFALSTGLSLTPDLMARLKSQLVRELIDDRLKAQEIARRHIVIPDEEVARAIGSVESRNGLQKGGLREKLAAAGVPFSALIEQTRTSLGWTRVLRQELAERGYVTPAEVAEQEAIFKRQQGQPQYHVAEIFVPAEDPSRQNDARKFADTVIQQLRAGAPFGIVAAEFSQSDTALKGGDLGWVRPDQLDPPIAQLVQSMPVGAVSNPVHVAGGFDVVTLQEKRLIGSDMATVLQMRQAFYPFTSQLDPANPTEQQKTALHAAQELSRTATSCDAVEAANRSQGSKRPGNPGEIRLDRVNPQMQALLKTLSPGHASKALVTPEGILVLMVCSSEQKNMAAMTKEDIADQLVQERVELASRQLQQDLKRKALIDQRQS